MLDQPEKRVLVCMYDWRRLETKLTLDTPRWFEEAESLAESVGTLPEKRPSSNIQTFPGDLPSEHYRRVISIPFLDHLKSQIQTRFFRK